MASAMACSRDAQCPSPMPNVCTVHGCPASWHSRLRPGRMASASWGPMLASPSVHSSTALARRASSRTASRCCFMPDMVPSYRAVEPLASRASMMVCANALPVGVMRHSGTSWHVLSEYDTKPRKSDAVTCCTRKWDVSFSSSILFPLIEPLTSSTDVSATCPCFATSDAAFSDTTRRTRGAVLAAAAAAGASSAYCSNSGMHAMVTLGAEAAPAAAPAAAVAPAPLSTSMGAGPAAWLTAAAGAAGGGRAVSFARLTAAASLVVWSLVTLVR
mmetsp:Transcript_10706/g.26404  ORF Transcript_10706/g.26404 Transcript_10706/m.26404 type:complete len:273 (+) Transcript_10706:938-1756(+)